MLISQACTTSSEWCVPAATEMPPSTPRPSVNVLVEGFEVPEFPLRRSSNGAEFSFMPTERTAQVVCALFVGSPRFERRRITNAAAVIPRFRAVEARAAEDFAFTMASLQAASTSDSNCGSPPAHFVVTSLSIGCWGLNSVDIVAATSMLTLDVGEVPQAQPPVVSCDIEDVAATAGRLCVPPGQVGICSEGACVEDTAGVLDASVTSEPENLVESCTAGRSGLACRIATTRTGRCSGGRCIPVEYEEQAADRLVVACRSAADDAIADANARLEAVATNAYSCLQTELGDFGTCYDRRCRRRCRSANQDEDCAPNAALLGGLTAETHCRALEAPFGVCVSGEDAER